MTKKCIAPGCKKTSNDTKSFFQFPKEPGRCHKWLRFCGLEDRIRCSQNVNENMLICQNHFLRSDYYSGERTILKKTAVPSIHSNGTVVPAPISSPTSPSEILLPSTSPSEILLPSSLSPPPPSPWRHRKVERTYARKSKIFSKNMSNSTYCYVCGFVPGATEAEGLSFHQASTKLTNRPTVEKWLKFLFLPPSNMWPNLEWQEICLCSLHFQEDDFCGRRMTLKNILRDGAVPTKKPPNGPGRYGILFTQGGQTKTVASEVPLPAEEEEEMITEPFALILDNSHSVTSENPPPAEEQEEMITEQCTSKLDDSYSGNSIENLNDLSRQMMLQDVTKDLCRLCGQKGTLLKPIFEPSYTEMSDISVSAKIHMHLPFKVNVDDTLPCHICLDCSFGLNCWHELYITCVAADAVLKKTLGGNILMSSQRDWNHSANREQDIIIPCASEVDPLVGAGSHEDTVVLNAENDTDKMHEANEQNEILCSVCGMNTPIKPSKEDDLLVEFESIYSKVRYERFKCNYCNEYFISSRAKKEHSRNCRNLSTICEICGRNVPRKNLVNHKYKYHQFISRVCDKCGKLFNNTHLLMKHFNRMHEEDIIPRFCCTLCCVAFAKKVDYVNHQTKHRKGKIKTVFQIKEQPEGGVYICPVCNETYSDALSLVVHLNSKKEMKCPSCRKQVHTEKMFLVHKCGKYKCRYCSKAYNWRMGWIVHERLHTGEKPFKCRVCDRSYRSIHLRSHHELSHAPLHQCPICIKKFREKSMYEDHLQWHQGKVFSCPICQKGFSTRVYVSNHLQKCRKSCEA